MLQHLVEIFWHTSGKNSHGTLSQHWQHQFFSEEQFWWTCHFYGSLLLVIFPWNLCKLFNISVEFRLLRMMHSFRSENPIALCNYIINLHNIGQLSELYRDNRWMVSENRICAWNCMCIIPSCTWHGMP